MASGYTHHFEEAVKALRTIESEELKRYNKAIDIEDLAEATAVTIDARTKILKLRQCVESLLSINGEIVAMFAIDPKHTASEITNIQPDYNSIPDETNNLNNSDESDTTTKKNTQNIPKTEPLGDAPSEFEFLGSSYPINGISDLIPALCELLILYRPYKFARMGGSHTIDKNGQLILSLNKQEIKEPHRKLSNGFYINTDCSASDIKSQCELMLVECGYSSEILKIR